MLVVIVLLKTSTEVLVSFERPTYTVNEMDESVEVCFLTNLGHPNRNITVSVIPQEVTDGSSGCADFSTARGMSIIIIIAGNNETTIPSFFRRQ